MTDLERYCTGILDGKIVACRRMKQVAERLLEDLASPGEFHFDPDIAARHIDFIQQFCKVPSGRLGTPLKLELFQRARLEAVFGFVDDSDLRRYNEVLIVEGRKNGKTTETAAIELDLLVNDGEGSPQIYNVATKLDQARLGYEAAVKMRQLSPMLAKHLRKRVSDIYNPMNMGYIRPMASNTSSLDGLDAHGATIDELAAIKNRDLYDLIKQAMGARDQPLLFVITTNGFVRGGIFDAQYQYACDILEGKADNPRFLPFLYELDDRAEWDNPDCWEKANPGLGTIKSRQYLAEMVQKAKDDPSFKPTVMVKDFNMPQTSEAAWLRWEELDNPTTFDLRFDYGIGGFDAADTTDLNAAKAICMRPDDPNIYVRSMYWIPKAVLEEAERAGSRRERDNVPYSLWVEQGYMRTCPGRKCDKHIFLEWFKELRDNEGLYMAYYVTSANDGYSGDLEIAVIPDSFRKDVLQETEDDTDKILVENVNAEPKPFALLFEFAGDQKAVRHVLYNCAATRPSLTGATTTNTKEPSTETITITASPLSSGVIKAKTTPDTPDEKYNAWYQSVWQQGAAAGGGGG